jgi:hypothetical protein
MPISSAAGKSAALLVSRPVASRNRFPNLRESRRIAVVLTTGWCRRFDLCGGELGVGVCLSISIYVQIGAIRVPAEVHHRRWGRSRHTDLDAFGTRANEVRSPGLGPISLRTEGLAPSLGLEGAFFRARDQLSGTTGSVHKQLIRRTPARQQVSLSCSPREVIMRAAAPVTVSLFTPFLLLACDSPEQGPTAPDNTPAFTKSANLPLDATHKYRLSLSCNSASPGSHASGEAAEAFSLDCDDFVERGAGTGSGGFGLFSYTIALNDATPAVIACSQTRVSTTGAFSCKYKKWSATLTVTDEGVGVGGPGGGI